MRKLLAIIVLGLLFNGCTNNSQEVLFKCLNKDGKEREYFLSIDLKKKIMKRAGIIYKIKKINDNTIYGLNKNNQYENNLMFDRHTGELQFISYKKNDLNTPTDIAIYSCVKSIKHKKLI
jgi:hypothetical protein